MKNSVERGTGNLTILYSLLKDNNYIQIVNGTISDVKQSYAANNVSHQCGLKFYVRIEHNCLILCLDNPSMHDEMPTLIKWTCLFPF